MLHKNCRLCVFNVLVLLSFAVNADSTQNGSALWFDDWEMRGFVEQRIGSRINDDDLQKNISIGEVRLQLDVEKDYEVSQVQIVADFVYDPVMDEYAIDLESGEGIIDLRQANISLTPLEYLDLKIGRQILTWGTGDLLFINDLFAKDWNSFLIGRDDEYLKAPTDAAKFSLFLGIFNLDVIYTPKFNADRYIDGQRITFYDPSTQVLRGSNNPLKVDRPDDWLEDDEWSLRLYNTIGTVEAALYYYNGFWKSPTGIDVVSGKALFPELQVIGGSLRGPLFSGIANIELGYYKSQSGSASNPFIRNDEYRVLFGYEWELAKELTSSMQYYLERKLDYSEYLASLPSGLPQEDENRQVVTLRLTQLLMQQDLILSLFNFYSPSDSDGYLKLSIKYKVTDELKMELGGNVFYGDKINTFYSQFKTNSNVYTALRYEY